MDNKDDLAPPVTSELVAGAVLGLAPGAGHAAWAGAMIDKGFDCPTLYLLVGEREPYDSQALAAMFTKVSRELGLPVIATPEEAIATLASAWIAQWRQGRLAQDRVLSLLFSLSCDCDFPDELQDFYLLYHETLSKDDPDRGRYWPAAATRPVAEEVTARFLAWDGAHDLGTWASFEWST